MLVCKCGVETSASYARRSRGIARLRSARQNDNIHEMGDCLENWLSKGQQKFDRAVPAARTIPASASGVIPTPSSITVIRPCAISTKASIEDACASSPAIKIANLYGEDHSRAVHGRQTRMSERPHQQQSGCCRLLQFSA